MKQNNTQIEKSVFLLEKYIEDINHDKKCEEDCRYVYLVRNPISNLCKIGITSDPRRRIKQLETTSGFMLQDLILLELEWEYDEPAQYVEKYLHQYFKHKRVKGEWFNLSIKDILAIKNLFWEKIGGMYIWDNVKLYLLKSKQNETEQKTKRIYWDN